MSCYSKHELRSYLLQQLTSETQARVEQHVATCDNCCRTLDLLASDDLVRAYFEAARREAEPVLPLSAASQSTQQTSTTSLDGSAERHLETADPRLPWQFDRFVLREVLGAGGFGVVYRADDINLQREVAVKIPHPGGLSTEVRRRFSQEGTAAANLHHPHIVPVHQSGTHRGICFLVSEFCPGQTLRQWLDQARDPISTNDAVRLVSQLAEAVDHAHQNGIVHRDIKPANVILDQRGTCDDLPFCAKLTDFGTARFLEADPAATRSGSLIGTVPYMAPEQLKGDRVGPACDIYALGVVLFELLTGHLPIKGSDSAETMHRVLNDDAPPAHRLRRDCPRDVSAICARCLEKKPSQRYASARDLAEDLQRFLNNVPTRARPLGVGARMFRWSRRNPLALTIMTAVCLLHLIVLGGVTWHTQRLKRLNNQLVAANHRAHQMQRNAEHSEHRARQLRYASDMRLAAKYLRERDPGSVRDILQRYKPQPGEPDLRGLEWSFLSRAIRSDSSLLAEVGSPLYCLRISPDGQRFATGGQDGLIRLYDREQGELLRTIASEQREVNSLAFAPDGHTLASAGDDGSVCVWRLADGEQLQRFAAHNGLVFGVEFTPAGDALATCGTDHVVHLWRNGACEFTHRDHTSRVEALAISPDGRWLASVGKDRTLVIRETESGKLAFKWDQAQGRLSSLAFSPDSQHVAVVEASGETTSMLLFDVVAQRRICARQHNRGIRSVAFSDGGHRLLSIDSAGVIRIWSVAHEAGRLVVADEPLVTWQAREAHALAGTFEPNGQSVLTVGSHGQVRRYENPERMDRVVLDAAALAADYQIANQLAIYDVAFRGATHELLASMHLGIATFTADGNAKPHFLRRGLDKRWSCLDTLRNADWFIAGGSSPLAATAQGRHVTAVVERQGSPTGPAHRLWESARNSSIHSVACSPTEDLVAVVVNDLQVDDQPKHLLLLDTTSGELVAQLPAASGTRPQFTQDGRKLVYGVQRNIYVVDLPTRQQQVLTDAHTESQCGLALSLNDQWLATCDEARVVKLWNLETLQQHAVFQGHRSQVSALVFSADSRTLLSSSFDGTVKAWSVISGQFLMDLHLDSASVSHMALSADDQRLAIVEDKSRVRIYHIAP